MKRLTRFSAIVGCVPLLSLACPDSVRIGTYAINLYSGNGSSSASNLSYQVDLANNFWNRAAAYVPGYGGCSHVPTTLEFAKTNTEVTKAHIRDNVSPTYGPGTREWPDFIFFAGHGTPASGTTPASLFLGGNAAVYGSLSPLEFTMGGLPVSTKNNRWFMAHSCALFPRPPIATTPANMWKPIFRGLRVMLGFESYIYDNWDGYRLFDRFWSNWTYNGMGIWESFYNSELVFGYATLGGYGLHPACLSGNPGDYCQESFQASTSAPPANANAGTYHSLVAGLPSYP